MLKIDQNRWQRKELFDFFSKVSFPFYQTTFYIDVTQAYRFSKEKQISFYFLMIYLINQSLNQIENFRYAIIDDEVFLLEDRQPSVTYLDKETQLFKIVYVPIQEDLLSYCRNAKKKCEEQTFFLDYHVENQQLFYYTCLPWIEMTSLTNEFDLINPKTKDDSIPRIAWGKIIEQEGRKKIALSLEVNHRFVDGVHIGKFALELQKAISALDEGNEYERD